MATKVAELRADLTLNSASFESSAQRARREFRQFQQSVQADTSAMQKSLASITGLFKGLAVGAIAAFGTAGVAGAIGMAIKEFKDSEQALLRLQGVLKATGNTTGLTARQIDELSSALEATTLATDDMVKAAAARLATFGTVAGTNFKRAIELANDMSAVFGGDVVGAVEKVGNALNNPVEGLKLLTREVRAFSPEVAESAKQLFEMGRAAEAQTLILDELAKRVGGAGEAQAGGLAGQFDRLQKVFANTGAQILEQTGLINGLADAIEAAGIAIAKVTGGSSSADVLAQKQGQIVELTKRLDDPYATLGGTREEEDQRRAAIQSRIDLLRQEIDEIIAAGEAQRERDAIAAKSLSDKANASQLAHKAEIKAIADEQTAEKTKSKVVVDLIAERQKREAAAAAERAKQRQGELASILAAYEEDKRVALAVEQQKQKAADDAAREQERIIQQQMDVVLEPVKEAGRQIQNILADSIYRGLNGEIQTVKEFFNTFKQIALQTVSQIAAASILSPTFLFGGGAAAPGVAPGVGAAGVGGVGGLGSLLGAGAFLGGGGATLASAFPSLFGAGGASLTALGGGSGAGALAGFGGASLAGIAGAAGLGLLGGSIIAPMVGLNATGGGLGAGLGAGLGFIAGGPVGAVAGGVLGGVGGGLLGNFFGGGGGGERNNNYRASFVNGTFANVSNTKPDQQNVNNVTQVGEQLAALYAALQGRGGTFTGTIGLNSGNKDGLQLTTASGTSRFGNVQELSLAAAKALISGTEGLSALDTRILGRSKATDAAGLIADLDFAEQFQLATGAVTPFVFELKKMLVEFDKADEKAKELGLSVAELNKAQAEQLQNLRDQKSAQILAIKQGFRSTVEGSFGFLQPIEQLRDNFNTATGGGTARSRLAEAQAQFERIQKQIAAGQVQGFEALPGAAQTLLNAARENFASGSGYQQIAELVQQVLDSAADQGEDAQQGLLDGIGNTVLTLKDIRENLLEQRDDVVEQLKALRRDIQKLDRAA